MEQEARLVRKYNKENLSKEALATEIDRLWGKVTLYNAYQLFVQLSSKKIRNPLTVFNENLKNKVYEEAGLTDEEIMAEKENAMKEAVYWDGKPEVDMLTLYFNATNALPKNSIRSLVSDADNSLRAIGGAEKMLARYETCWDLCA